LHKYFSLKNWAGEAREAVFNLKYPEIGIFTDVDACVEPHEL
jgi:hypothetical protein